MKLHFEKANLLSKLHDELLSQGINPHIVQGDENNIYLTFKEDLTQEEIDRIQLIINNHDITPLPIPPTQEEVLNTEINNLKTENEDLKVQLASVNADLQGFMDFYFSTLQ